MPGLPAYTVFWDTLTEGSIIPGLPAYKILWDTLTVGSQGLVGHPGIIRWCSSGVLEYQSGIPEHGATPADRQRGPKGKAIVVVLG